MRLSCHPSSVGFSRRELIVFVDDNVTTLDQYPVLWVPLPIDEVPIGSISEKYALKCLGVPACSFSPLV